MDLQEQNGTKRIYRISEKRVYDEPRFVTSNSGYLHGRTKGYTVNMPSTNVYSRNVSSNQSLYKSHQFSRVKSTNVMATQSNLSQSNVTPKLGYSKFSQEGSLSSKIKANLFKNKTKHSNLNLIKMNKNKTLIETKKKMEKSYFKSNTIKNSKQKLSKQNTLKTFSRQNSGKYSKPFQFKKDIRANYTPTNNKPYGLHKLKPKIQKPIKFLKEKSIPLQKKPKIKHIGNILPEPQIKPNPQTQLLTTESSKEIKTSTLIHNINFSNQETRADTLPRESELRSLPRISEPRELPVQAMNVFDQEKDLNQILETFQEKDEVELNKVDSGEEEEADFNPFKRKPEAKLDLDLPDLGVVSNEKEKEGQTNLTDRSVDQYLNRRKTKFSKEVAKYIADKEEEEELKTPTKNAAINRKKVIRLKWRNSKNAYVQVVEYEDVPVEKSEKRYQTPEKTKEEKEELNIKRLKKFVNTPKNIKSQIRGEEDPSNLITSATKPDLKMDNNIFNFKKSHSTYNLQSHTKEEKPLKLNLEEERSVDNTKMHEKCPSPPVVNKTFQRKHTTFYEEKAKHYRPIYENFGECPANEYRLIIYKMDKNSKTDKIFFNNPTNYSFPEKLLVFDTRSTVDPSNMSFELVSNLKTTQQEKKMLINPESRYYDMSQVVNLEKTLKPSNYHDLNALQMDFSFPEDKPKSPVKPKFFNLVNGAEQIDEFTYRIGGIEFKDYRGKNNSKSASVLPNLPSTTRTTSNSHNTLSRGGTQHKSYTFLPRKTQHITSNENQKGKLL